MDINDLNPGEYSLQYKRSPITGYTQLVCVPHRAHVMCVDGTFFYLDRYGYIIDDDSDNPQKESKEMRKYKISSEDQARLDNEYRYHAPKDDQVLRYGDIRSAAKTFAMCIMENCPHSRERSLALTKVRQAVMDANASIAINE